MMWNLLVALSLLIEVALAEQCPPLRSPTVDVSCKLGGQEVSCDQPMSPETTITAACKPHHHLDFTPDYSPLICQEDGRWSRRLFNCDPDCGFSIKDKSQTVSDSSLQPHQGEFPWLAAVYYKRNNGDKWEQQCAGTLVSPRMVLTAAHCLVDREVVVKPEDLKVGLGKYWRDYYKHENNSLIANVRKVILPKNYVGGSTFYVLDIVLLYLAQSVSVTAFIMPACVDWGSTHSLTSGDVGHVAGWDRTEDNTSNGAGVSDQLSYIDYVTCVKQVHSKSKRFVTHDKFCATSSNGSKVERGNSGAGLTVVKKGQHFIFGVFSVMLIDENKLKLFTDTKNVEHFSWLSNQRYY